ncbi:5-hydroxytryptamine receptor 2A-like [Gigantopelta aegis]|uniref:5-hydroxytryptamine receptor 2A-like n=1 Tax=Gigantopelta aegis TaxID=1735272 RepID=UPI001B88CF2F|nr:5-hydroxytryptamine receptor 2A-like [Gigantopelta aegis]
MNETLRFINDTVMEEITDKEDVVGGNRWPYFRLEGKTYLTFILIIASLGVVGNVMSFILMSDEKLRLLAYSVYLRWLAVSDSMLLMMVATEDTLDTYRYLGRFHTLHVTVCKGWNFIEATTYTLSPWLVLALTLDRFVCVVFPLSRHKLCTKSKAFKLCSTVTLMSAALNVVSLIYLDIEDDECTPSFNLHLTRYLIFQQLLKNAFLPYVAILILNIVTVIWIRRSASFRQQFKRSGGSEATKERQDKNTLPLILISVFAFVTLIPRTVTEATEYMLESLQSDAMALKLANHLWPLFNVIYLVNFGQNFFILMASSSEYRQLLGQKLTCHHKDNRNTSSAQRKPSTPRTSSTQFSDISVSKMVDIRSVTSRETTVCSDSSLTSPPV